MMVLTDSQLLMVQYQQEDILLAVAEEVMVQEVPQAAEEEPQAQLLLAELEPEAR